MMIRHIGLEFLLFENGSFYGVNISTLYLRYTSKNVLYSNLKSFLSLEKNENIFENYQIQTEDQSKFNKTLESMFKKEPPDGVAVLPPNKLT